MKKIIILGILALSALSFAATTPTIPATKIPIDHTKHVGMGINGKMSPKTMKILKDKGLTPEMKQMMVENGMTPEIMKMMKDKGIMTPEVIKMIENDGMMTPENMKIINDSTATPA